MVNPFFAKSEDYIKKPTLSSKKMRVPFMLREKAAIIKLRQHGYSINALSVFSGRSSSVIHSILKRAGYTPGCFIASSWLNAKDLRKLPSQVRLKSAQIIRLGLVFQIDRWMPFVLGEVDKPP